MAANTYTPQAGDVLFPGATAVTEDQTLVGGFVAACEEAATTAILAAYGLVQGTAATVTKLTQQQVAAGQTVGKYASSGQSTASGAQWLSSQYGVTLQSEPWQQALGLAGQVPIELGVSNAAALGPQDAGVGGHFEDIFGRTASGLFIANDPNSPQSQNGQFVLESQAQIAASQPFFAGVPTAMASAAGSAATTGTCNNSTFLVGAIGNIFCNLSSGTQAVFQSVVQLLIRAGVILAGAVLILVALIFLMRERG